MTALKKTIEKEEPIEPNMDETDSLKQIPQKPIIGIADGKYKMPPEEMLLKDEITELIDE